MRNTALRCETLLFGQPWTSIFAEHKNAALRGPGGVQRIRKAISPGPLGSRIAFMSRDDLSRPPPKFLLNQKHPLGHKQDAPRCITDANNNVVGVFVCLYFQVTHLLQPRMLKPCEVKPREPFCNQGTQPANRPTVAGSQSTC